MFACESCFRSNEIEFWSPPHASSFTLPAPLPNWPPGRGFGSGKVNLGEIEVCKVSNFEFICGCHLLDDKRKGVSFYKPARIPTGFYSLGHSCQPNCKPSHGFLLVARSISSSETDAKLAAQKPPLRRPLDYTLVWSTEDGISEDHGNGGAAFFWLPQPPNGYQPMGFLVTNDHEKPDLDDVRCVRDDLTDKCESHRLLIEFSNALLSVWTTRPARRGIFGRGVSVGTFFCTSNDRCNSARRHGNELDFACLKNVDSELHAMPDMQQIHCLVRHYGPTVFFHPDEIYLPSSVSWFFENGARLHTAGDLVGERIDSAGSNLPAGGSNDGAFWIDLPSDKRRRMVSHGNLESAELYVHVKPALGGTFTDVAMWVFCPFNGPATIKVGLMNVQLSKIGQHVGDWEHFTLRICNFTGELWSLYLSQHCGGEWVDACELEYVDGNKAAVYSSKGGHASFAHPGTHIQGSTMLGLGVRNDAARSSLFVDSSTHYEIVAAEYLGEAVRERFWLQFMREWGPTTVYDSRLELDKIIHHLPVMLRSSVQNMFNRFPIELYGEEGPTGPKEKNNWLEDERG